MSKQKNLRLRELLQGDGLLVAPGCHDGLTARLIQQTGFSAAYMGGNGSMASYLGLPDIGLATETEMVTRARYLTQVLDIPLICDADTGYGDILNVIRTVRDFESAGVSAIHIEDQQMPKRCGAMEGVQVVPLEEICAKLRAALQARKDPNFMIIGRTDSYNTMGVEECIRRCKCYWDTGVDMLMPENLVQREDVERVAYELKRYKSPYRSDEAILLYDVAEFTEGQIFSDEELWHMGYRVVVHPLASIMMETKAAGKLYSEYKREGTTINLYREGFFEDRQVYQEYLGYSEAIKTTR